MYLIEGHYVTPDDAAAGNQDNNASFREVVVTGVDDFNMDVTGSTQRERVNSKGDPSRSFWSVAHLTATRWTRQSR